jgi:hypothetical protein
MAVLWAFFLSLTSSSPCAGVVSEKPASDGGHDNDRAEHVDEKHKREEHPHIGLEFQV